MFQDAVKKTDEVIVMPVMIFSDPYCEDTENLRNIRYAIVSTLVASPCPATANGRPTLLRTERMQW